MAMEVQKTPLNLDSTTWIVDDSTLYQTQMLVALSDTSNVSQLEVKLRKTSGASDLLQKTFTYDVSGAFTDGTSYQRAGYNITLGLGNYYGLSTEYGELRIRRTDSSLSDPVTFSR